MATIYDVAKRAKVSTYTVSSVLNKSAYVSPELTKRVLKAVTDLDYTINDLARSLQTRKTRTVGMVIPDIANPFYANVVRGVEDRLREAGYSLILGNTYNQVSEQARYLGVFRSKQVDGTLMFIAAGDETEPARWVRQQRPLVFLGRAPKTFEADTVSADNRKGVGLATAHLIAEGHTRIAVVVGELALAATEERLDGWRRTLQESKLEAPEAYIGEGDWTAQSGASAASMLLSLPSPPTAMIAMNFLMMTGVLRAIRRHGLVCPHDVTVMSSDDSEWLDVFDPPISTIVQPSYDMGSRAADLLIARIADPGKPFEVVRLMPQLHIRGARATLGVSPL